MNTDTESLTISWANERVHEAPNQEMTRERKTRNGGHSEYRRLALPLVRLKSRVISVT